MSQEHPRERALARLRKMSACARRYTCPLCSAAPAQPCPSCPTFAHFERLEVAAQALGFPEQVFGQIADTIKEACPALPEGDPQPEITRSGRIALYRGAPTVDPWLGRGSFWIASRAWASSFALIFGIRRAHPYPYGVWRAEAAITSRTACELPTDDLIRPNELAAYLRDHPAWPGGTWLLYRDQDPENTRGTPVYKQVCQYLYVGRGTVRAVLTDAE